MRLHAFGVWVVWTGIALAGCSESAGPGLTDELVGQWAWVSSFGGIAGIMSTPASTGMEMTVHFTSDDLVRVTRNGVATEWTRFVIGKGGDETGFVVTYDVSPFGFPTQTGHFPEVDVLILVDPCFDGFESSFERVR